MSLARMPDLDVARRFLTLLDEDAEQFTFQIFADRKAGRVTPCHRYGDLDGLADWLSRQNRQGAGIFVTVNETDGRGREAENVRRVRAGFIDLDDAATAAASAELAQRLLEPHIVCESSPGKRHLIWRVEGLPLESFTP